MYWFQHSWMHSHSILPRAPRQRATHNNDMAIEPEEGGKLAQGRLQSALPVRAKTRRKTITPDGYVPSLWVQMMAKGRTSNTHAKHYLPTSSA